MLVIRSFREEDKNFVYSTWLKMLHARSHLARVPGDIFFPEYQDILDSIIAKSKVSVIALKEDENVILGYICYEPRIVHFVYIKGSFRGRGVLRSLLKCAGITSRHDPMQITHFTSKLAGIYRQLKNITYNPFLIKEDLYV